MVASSDDRALVKGRVWGDFEETGTAPLVAIPLSVFDKKPVADGIKYVADIVGYLAFVDEGGGFVFHSPNIWSVGNWIGDGGPNSGRTSTIVVIDETQTLMSLGAKRVWPQHPGEDLRRQHLWSDCGDGQWPQPLSQWPETCRWLYRPALSDGQGVPDHG